MTVAHICHGCKRITQTRDGYCQDCRPAVTHARNNRPVSRIYSTAGWKRARVRALNRDGHTCTRCGAPANTVHHADGYDDPFNSDLLESLCASCHAREDGRRSHQPSRVQAT